MKKVRFSMPTRWRNFLTILTDWPDRSPDRLIYKIEQRLPAQAPPPSATEKPEGYV